MEMYGNPYLTAMNGNINGMYGNINGNPNVAAMYGNINKMNTSMHDTQTATQNHIQIQCPKH